MNYEQFKGYVGRYYTTALINGVLIMVIIFALDSYSLFPGTILQIVLPIYVFGVLFIYYYKLRNPFKGYFIQRELEDRIDSILAKLDFDTKYQIFTEIRFGDSKENELELEFK